MSEEVEKAKSAFVCGSLFCSRSLNSIEAPECARQAEGMVVLVGGVTVADADASGLTGTYRYVAPGGQ